MKDNSYYVRYGFQICLVYLMVSLLLGDFYPFVKSLFVNDSDSATIFSSTFESINWIKHLTKSLFVGIGGYYLLFQLPNEALGRNRLPGRYD